VEVLIVWAYNIWTSVYHVCWTPNVFYALVRKTTNNMKEGSNN